jgi:hypothetical protein
MPGGRIGQMSLPRFKQLNGFSRVRQCAGSGPFKIFIRQQQRAKTQQEQ